MNSSLPEKESLTLVFMGTPEFAVPSLRILHQSSHKVVAVVTAPDKPAGRGRQLTASPVKQFAVQHNIPVLQPEKLKNPDFIRELQDLQADLFIVVAFRMLPEQVWSMPPYGCFNLHASLLPQYRGAAPINRAIMNGETTTGITTFFIEKDIDTGRIIYQEETPIAENETAGELHDRLMENGSRLVLKTVDAIARRTAKALDQKSLPGNSGEIKNAPKIFRNDCEISWNRNGKEIVHQIRGLSPFPGAFTYLALQEEKILFKIFQARFEHGNSGLPPGTLAIKNGNEIHIGVNDGLIIPLSVQAEGKKRMNTVDFLRGINQSEKLKLFCP